MRFIREYLDMWHPEWYNDTFTDKETIECFQDLFKKYEIEKVQAPGQQGLHDLLVVYFQLHLFCTSTCHQDAEVLAFRSFTLFSSFSYTISLSFSDSLLPSNNRFSYSFHSL